MQPDAIQVISIHDHQGEFLAFDLKHVLQVLEARLADWAWCLTVLDGVGGEYSEAVCRQVERAGRLWLSTPELNQLANDIRQTIDAECIGFPAGVDRQKVSDRDVDLGYFPSGRAGLAIVAVDGSYYEVYAKDPELVESLRKHFKEVRLEDPSRYFSATGV
jgi:hypothetical protein